MIKVELFGNFRLMAKCSEITVCANTVGEMLKEISDTMPNVPKKDIMGATLFLNDRAVQGVFRNRKRLTEGDRVLMMYPSSGG